MDAPQLKFESAIQNRIFCVGLNKTGTSTMKRCYDILGLLPVASPTTFSAKQRRVVSRFKRDRNYSPVLELAEQFSAFEDRPWNMWSMYRQLDERFPDSRFILTWRDPDSWWRSVEQWITVTKPQTRNLYQLHLRASSAEREAMLDGYLRYNTEVEEYFSGTGRLLKIDFEAGEGWQELCTFLNMPIPERDFPHINRRSYSSTDADRRNNRRRLKNGIRCQSCKHVTPNVKKTEGYKGSQSTPPLVTNRDKVLLPLRLVKRGLQSTLGRGRHRNSIRRGFYGLHLLNKCLARSIHTLTRVSSRRLHDRKLDDKELAVVSCFYNPSGSRRRVANFKRFRQGIEKCEVRCLAVELAFGSAPFQLEGGEDTIQLRTIDVMWHKERLLNIGIERLLAEGYQKIAWLDGDIVFHDKDWPQRLSETLDKANLCQVFGKVAIVDTAQDYPLIAPSSVKYFLDRDNLHSQTPNNLPGLIQGCLLWAQSGFGWAARADVLRQQLLFDKAIVGGADKLIFIASVSDNHSGKQFVSQTYSTVYCEQCGHRNRSEAFTESFLEWARAWHAAVDGKVTYANLQISDMYHGKRQDRNYLGRRELMYRHDYNPDNDVSIDESGCLAWASDNTGLHRDVESYFLSRREDT